MKVKKMGDEEMRFDREEQVFVTSLYHEVIEARRYLSRRIGVYERLMGQISFVVGNLPRCPSRMCLYILDCLFSSRLLLRRLDRLKRELEAYQDNLGPVRVLTR